jgi:hypothetical protein
VAPSAWSAVPFETMENFFKEARDGICGPSKGTEHVAAGASSQGTSVGIEPLACLTALLAVIPASKTRKMDCLRLRPKLGAEPRLCRPVSLATEMAAVPEPLGEG